MLATTDKSVPMFEEDIATSVDGSIMEDSPLVCPVSFNRARFALDFDWVMFEEDGSSLVLALLGSASERGLPFTDADDSRCIRGSAGSGDEALRTCSSSSDSDASDNVGNASSFGNVEASELACSNGEEED
mmetsp:Transcript_24218/g.40653  ORF Transcript_24218/g.40653 Transcript_24218/m.40653 type:complete len:131 (-) Transcript_24218:636-1028(-)